MSEATLWPAAPGEMAERIRHHDWAATPLGPIGDWPPSLRLALEMVLAMPWPATLIWGSAEIQLYNDAYVPIARDRHPDLLGRPVSQGWAEAYDQVLRPVLEKTRSGLSTKSDGNHVTLRGPDGAPEERVLDSAWSPVRDEAGTVAGALEVLTEVTERHRALARLRDSEERQAFLLKLSDGLRPLADPAAIEGEACRLLAEELGANHAHYGEIDEKQGVGSIRRDFSRGGLPSLVGRIPLADFGDIISHYKRIGTIVVPDVPNSVLLSPADRNATVALRMLSLASVPLIKDGKVVGALVVAESEPRAWTDAEIRLVEETAERIWAAIERARAEAALRESEERFRLIVENARDYAIFTIDPEGRVTDWLPGAGSFFGWTADEIRGQSVSLTFTAEDRAAGEPERERDTARREGAAPNVRWHVRKDGSRVFIDGIATAVRDADGVLKGFLKIGQDVTERRDADAALRESEERLRGFAEASSDVLWIADAGSRRLEYLSPAYEEIWGEPRDAIMADLSRWKERLHPEGRLGRL